MKNAHRLSKIKVFDQAVRHFNSLGLHRMILAEYILGDLFVINVGYMLRHCLLI